MEINDIIQYDTGKQSSTDSGDIYSLLENRISCDQYSLKCKNKIFIYTSFESKSILDNY